MNGGEGGWGGEWVVVVWVWRVRGWEVAVARIEGLGLGRVTWGVAGWGGVGWGG